MASAQEQEAKKQKIEQETPQVEEAEVLEEQEEEETNTVEYDEEDMKLGHALIAAVIANDLVSDFFHQSSR